MSSEDKTEKTVNTVENDTSLDLSPVTTDARIMRIGVYHYGKPDIDSVVLRILANLNKKYPNNK